jgi:hypothetical protein
VVERSNINSTASLPIAALDGRLLVFSVVTVLLAAPMADCRLRSMAVARKRGDRRIEEGL